MKTTSTFLVLFFICLNIAFPQGVAINTSGVVADGSAMIDVSSVNKGALIPRMTTAQRDLIVSPADGLTIFNLDCGNFNYYFNGNWHPLNNGFNNLPGTAGSISGSSSVCQGHNGVSFSVPAINNATGYIWMYSGSGATISGNTNQVSIDFSGSATSGNLTVIGGSACGNGTVSQNFPVTVNSAPGTPSAGNNSCTYNEITWNWAAVTGATGYKYNTTTDYNSSVDVGTNTTYTQTGLSCNTNYNLYVWAYNTCGYSYYATLSQTTSSVCPVSVGDSYQGGIVAYLLQSGDPGYDVNVQHGLIAATTDQSSSVQWGCKGSSISGTSTALGSGQANTNLIVQFHNNLPNYYGNPTQCNAGNDGTVAALMCDTLAFGGYSDWFLPSIDELGKLYQNRNSIGGFTTSGTPEYWSSSEGTSYPLLCAWDMIFSSGTAWQQSGKHNLFFVRCIRTF